MPASTISPKGMDAVREQRKRQQEDPRFQKMVAAEAKRGTNRNIYLLMDRLFQSSIPDEHKGGIWIETPNGLMRRERWHQRQASLAIKRRKKAKRQKRRAAKATKRRQRERAKK